MKNTYVKYRISFQYFNDYSAPPQVGGRGIVFGRFISFFVSLSATLRENGWTICMKFSGKVCSDHGTTWLHFGSIRVNGSAGQRLLCLLSPAVAQRTGVNTSVSFARWQQGGGVCCASHHSLFSIDFIDVMRREEERNKRWREANWSKLDMLD